jgi:hypothetical protein
MTKDWEKEIKEILFNNFEVPLGTRYKHFPQTATQELEKLLAKQRKELLKEVRKIFAQSQTVAGSLKKLKELEKDK